MPFRTVPNTDVKYALIAFGKDGVERNDDPDGKNGRMSERIVDILASEPFTDVFLISHGWKGDVPAAIGQYDRWIRAMNERQADRQRAGQQLPGFKPFLIGLHWPSLPWGDEEFGDSKDTSFADPATTTPVEQMVDKYVERLGDKPEIRESLQIIFEEARDNAAAFELPERAQEAYRRLNDALEMGADGEGGAPGNDREPFDPQAAFQAGEDEVSFGGPTFGGILGPLRQLSFWKMKDRARKVGEHGMHPFLERLMKVTAQRNVRFHLMGHSFGCVVVSATLGGPGGRGKLPRPVNSVALVQGALSIWSYCPDNPHAKGTPGYFHNIVKDRKVSGPIITTISEKDTAVGRFYPLGAGIARQVSFAPGSFPKYGALGSFGAQGLEAGVENRPMLKGDAEYGFRKGTIYNLESSQFIAKGDGASGAHNDIAGPEVAHAVWQAALASI